MEWSVEVGEADWWRSRLAPWGAEGIRFLVPGGFESITRVFHPVELADGEMTSWTALAHANGRVAHPEMQLHTIATPAGQPVDGGGIHRGSYPAVGGGVHDEPYPAVGGGVHDGPYPAVGELPLPEMRAAAAALSAWTSTPDRCWFGVWDGYGQLHGSRAVTSLDDRRRLGRRRSSEAVAGLAPLEIRDGPRVRGPGRDYLLLRGALAAIDEAAAMLGGQSPNLWWPEDRSWFVVSEIDFAWTYVASSEEAIGAIKSSPALEALRSDYSHSATIDSDRLNPSPPQPSSPSTPSRLNP